MSITPQALSAEASPPDYQPGSPPRTRKDWQVWLMLGLILFLALSLRLYRIDASSLWYDEGWSVHLAREPLGRALQQIGSEGHTHPPGYYLLLMAWVRLFGSSVLAVRGFSVLVGILTVWAIYRLGSSLFDRRTGLLAAFALAIAPSHIVYSQETRMYALLALAFAGLLNLWYRYIYRGASWRRRDWVTLVLAEVLAIYTHYFSFLALAGLGLWALWVLARRAREGASRPLVQWLGSQALVALCFVPWLGTAVQRTATHVAEQAAAPGMVSFIMQVWAFMLGGHIALWGREPFFASAVLACLVVVTGLVVWLLLSDRTERRAIEYLGFQAIVPLALVYIVMQIRPGFHPRYVLMVLIPLLLLVARGIIRLFSHGWAGRVARTVVILLWLGATVLAARALLTDGYYVRDNARGTAAYLLQRLPSEAVVFADNDDWALRYYLEDASLGGIYLDAGQPAPEVEEAVVAALEDAAPERTNGHETALVKWNQGETDRRGLLPYLLEQHGAWVETHYLAGYTVFVYDLDEEPPALAEREVNVRVGPLRILRATVEQETPADEALTVTLTWHLENTTGRDCKVALSLVDDQGRRLASSDREIRDSRGTGTSNWSVGQEVTGYYVLNLPAGIAPLDYALQAIVYDQSNSSGLDVLDAAGAATGKSLILERVTLAPSRGRVEKTVDREKSGLHATVGSTKVAAGLELRAFGLDRDQVRTGEKLSVALEWHSTAGDLPDYRPALRLVRDGLTLAEEDEAPANGRYPTSWWGRGATVVEQRALLIPPDIEGGVAEVQIGVPGEASLSLGQITVEKVVRSFLPPQSQVETNMPLGDVAELVGYDLAATDLPAGVPFSITLYWRALGSTAKPYVVFVHLLNEMGQVIAQHDGPPAGGERPTTGWVEQEYVADAHTLQWLTGDGQPLANYQGLAMIEVGLYDPSNGERLNTPRGDSRLLLPSSIMVRQ
jgi:4-amino-4-deoxy-L-arabinose transferase-like glycosyltransferase